MLLVILGSSDSLALIVVVANTSASEQICQLLAESTFRQVKNGRSSGHNIVKTRVFNPQANASNLKQKLVNGRYWDRTSDNLLVREVLYR